MNTDYPPYHSPTPSQAHAVKTYQANHLQGVAGRDAMAEAMRVIIHKLLMARDAYAAKALEEMCEHTGKIIKILDVLREELAGSGALEDTEAAEAARFLHGFYADAILRITNVLATPEPEVEFNNLVELFKPLHERWKSPPPAAANAEEPSSTNSYNSAT